MVPYARDSFYAGRAEDFDSLTAMQADAVRWCRQVANARPSRALDRVAPQAVFDAEEAGALLRPAGGSLRVGGLVDPEGRARHPRQGGQGPLLGAVGPHRPPARRPRRQPARSSCSWTAS